MKAILKSEWFIGTHAFHASGMGSAQGMVVAYPAPAGIEMSNDYVL